jgi:hypothetical protein
MEKYLQLFLYNGIFVLSHGLFLNTVPDPWHFLLKETCTYTFPPFIYYGTVLENI